MIPFRTQGVRDQRGNRPQPSSAVTFRHSLPLGESSPSFALVATLLMIAAITGAAVAFFQSMRVERMVSRNYSDLARARMAAEGAADDAQELITSLFSNYPDSATAWARLTARDPQTQFTAYYFRTTDTNNLRAAQGFLTNGSNAAVPASPAPVLVHLYPLVSGANDFVASNLTSASQIFTNTNTPGGQAGLTVQNSVDLNADRWIGKPPDDTVTPQLRAKWLEVLRDPTRPKNTNRNSAGEPINPAIARYAFWMEDESFRLNVNWAGNNPRGGPNREQTNLLGPSLGRSPAEAVVRAALRRSENITGDRANFANGILLLQQQFSNSVDTRIVHGSLWSTPYRLPTPDSVWLARNTQPEFPEEFKYLFTTHSSALNFSRGGVQRLNLNQVVFSNGVLGSTSDNAAIRLQLDRILAAITNQYAMPAFGQRFYRLGTDNRNPLNATNEVTEQHARIYLQKIAANIRDYIDTDSQPTVVNNDGTLANGWRFSVPPQGGDPNSFAPWNDFLGNGLAPNEVAAVGQEALPLLTEFAVRGWHNGDWEGNNFNFTFCHYFEFWNPYNKDIPITALGTNPSLRILNMYLFDPGLGGTVSPKSPPVGTVTLSSFAGLTRFPANSFTVLTTDPNPIPSGLITNNTGQPITNYFGSAGTGSISYSGTSPRQRISAVLGTSAGRAGTRLTDYDLWSMLFNNNGVMSSFTALATGQVSGFTSAMELTASSTNVVRPSSLAGNSLLTRTGDPRSLNEQLSIQKHGATGIDSGDHYRFLNTTLEQSSFGALGTQSTAGRFVNVSTWPDWSGTNAAAGSNLDYAAIRDSRMLGIGELGHIYDPVRIANATGNVEFSRGGGRTLKIGQREAFDAGGSATPGSYTIGKNPYGLWGGTNALRSMDSFFLEAQTAPSRNWTAWRLTDVFCVDPPDRNGTINNNGTPLDPQDDWNIPEPEEAEQIHGLLNINGLNRDGALAFRALLWDLEFLPYDIVTNPNQRDGTPTTGGSAAMGKYVRTNNLVDLSGSDPVFRDNNLLRRVRGANDNLPNDDGIFWERGEISERDIFSRTMNNTATMLVSDNTVSMNTTLDRGREELVRRLLDMICTKGNTYRVYAIGQALDPRTGRPLASQKLQRTFRVNPRFASDGTAALPADFSFDPTQTGRGEGSTQQNDRFRRPAGWFTQTLQEKWN